MEASKLKAARLLEQMSAHLATDAGKEIANKVGFVYQLNISPKKMGVDEEIFVVDLKKGAVSTGPREVRGDAGRGLHLHRRRLPRHRQRQAEPADGVYKGQAEDQGEHQRRAEVHAGHLPQAVQVVERRVAVPCPSDRLIKESVMLAMAIWCDQSVREFVYLEPPQEQQKFQCLE
ncbi:uncharacterized protein [Triticum aestivum]|uniref:uncharacterized protein isoform X1 n=1 Tax=Triticum aestivum TaxID=4565 RepID=UPI001D028686|nr:uncharacterized protein LOC123128587 isoform X1 [Triticum aestivum]